MPRRHGDAQVAACLFSFENLVAGRMGLMMMLSCQEHHPVHAARFDTSDDTVAGWLHGLCQRPSSRPLATYFTAQSLLGLCRCWTPGSRRCICMSRPTTDSSTMLSPSPQHPPQRWLLT
jgi:hypothetical protein